MEPAANVQPQPKPYNPRDHLIKIKTKEGLKDYYPAVWRLYELNLRYENANFQSEIVSLDVERNLVVVKCRLYLGADYETSPRKTEAMKSGLLSQLDKVECVPVESEIVTKHGFKRYDTLAIGEEVLAYDLSRDECVWTPLRAVRVYEDSPLVHMYNSQFDVRCTPDHSWVTLHENGTRALVKAHDLKTTHRIITAAPAPSGDHPLSPTDASIIGWIMTDGTLRIDGSGGRYVRSHIYQSKQETVETIRELVGGKAQESIREGTTRTFPSGRTYEALPQHIFTFSSDETRRLLESSGIQTAMDLPCMVTQYSHEARAAMLAAMMMADGDKNRNFGKKRKPGVMDAWQLLATLEGYSLGKLYIRSGMPQQRLKKERGAFYVSALSFEFGERGDVWCPTTDYGTWVMRQNGQIMITGNTAAKARCARDFGCGTEYALELASEVEEAEAVLAERPERAEGTARVASHDGTRPLNALSVQSVQTFFRQTYRVSAAEFATRWPKFKKYVLKTPTEVADGDLSEHQLTELNSVISQEWQRQHTSVTSAA